VSTHRKELKEMWSFFQLRGLAEFGLGFVADRKRQCMALSRARDGLIIIGDERMGDNNESERFKAWQRLVGHHHRQNRLLRIQGDSQLLKTTFSILNYQEHKLTVKT
jgi:superfamily I DNA and/or RNA helicase